MYIPGQDGVQKRAMLDVWPADPVILVLLDYSTYIHIYIYTQYIYIYIYIYIHVCVCVCVCV